MGRDPYCTSLASYLHVDKGLWFPLPLQSHSCTLWSPVHYFYVYFIVVVIKFLKNKSGHSCSHVLLSYYDLTQNFDTLLWVQCSRRSFHTSDNNLQSSSICNFISNQLSCVTKAQSKYAFMQYQSVGWALSSWSKKVRTVCHWDLMFLGCSPG